LREAAGISRYELADALGYSWDAIYGWEKGTVHPSYQSLINWCEYFGFVLDLKDVRG